MRQPRNFATDRCCHLVSRIANRAFYLSAEERTRFVERVCQCELLHGAVPCLDFVGRRKPSIASPAGLFATPHTKRRIRGARKRHEKVQEV